ncbi:exopolysaccharide biosynthesis protein [Rhizobium glycinendophyticum]|uniref:Exopolysaccharide biosynthesis protein n=1 Tax=Rhizobium glycinendophyticum TaxID=2589807 RepID=A0A504UDH2_9HYPH|nr:exopolysaccharide biosynthesis protein [Rhizobium glycinendophyticum]TPP11797.1 exopolysaccharide biosynthesis protein [Rhizobium glycinendophyticum]
MTTKIGFQDTDRSTSAVLEEVIASMDGEHVTLRQILQIMGESGLLLLCGLLSLPFLVPVSIPGVSTVFGAGIVLIGVAITFNRFPWLPAKVADRQLDTGRLVPVLERGLKILRKVDRYVRPRLLGLTTGAVVNRINGLVLTAAGVLLMMPLSFIPFSNTLPGVAILLLSTGISQRDGAVVAAGHLMVVLALLYFGALAYAAVAAGQSLDLFGG